MPKQRTEQAWVVRILKDNMQALFDFADRVPELRDRSTPVRLAEWINAQGWGDRVGKSTIYRMVNAEGPVVIDTLELVARAFDLHAWHLLTPGLDPGNPPHLLASEQERELWNSIKKLRGPLSALANHETPPEREHDRGDAAAEGAPQGAPDAAGDRAGPKHRHSDGGAAKKVPAKR